MRYFSVKVMVIRSLEAERSNETFPFVMTLLFCSSVFFGFFSLQNLLRRNKFSEYIYLNKNFDNRKSIQGLHRVGILLWLNENWTIFLFLIFWSCSYYNYFRRRNRWCLCFWSTIVGFRHVRVDCCVVYKIFSTLRSIFMFLEQYMVGNTCH